MGLLSTLPPAIGAVKPGGKRTRLASFPSGGRRPGHSSRFPGRNTGQTRTEVPWRALSPGPTLPVSLAAVARRGGQMSKHLIGRTVRGAGGLAILAGLSGTPAALAHPGHGNRAATIAGSFADSCRDFAAHSNKDISFVELHYASGRVVRRGCIHGHDWSIDGGPGDELDFTKVKSGTTIEEFTCEANNAAPEALLEIQTPPIDQTFEHLLRLLLRRTRLRAVDPADRLDERRPDTGRRRHRVGSPPLGLRSAHRSLAVPVDPPSAASAAATRTATSRAGRSTSATARRPAAPGAPRRPRWRTNTRQAAPPAPASPAPATSASSPSP